MKKIFLAFILLTIVICGKAQFDEGTTYIGAYTSSLGFTYNTAEKFKLNMGVTAGKFLWDDVLAKAYIGYNHTEKEDAFVLGLGGRYYFEQNGIFMGLGAEYAHAKPNFNSFSIPAEVGYAFFINHYLTLEPSVYYKMSLTDFSDESTIGFKVGLCFYFE